jgi:carboxynorspermidine decarboxylase
MENNKTIDIFKDLQTPSYVCFEEKLEQNLKLLKYVKNKSGVKILLALKGFAFSPLLPMVMKYLDGCCASGLHEALYANDFKANEIHTYSPAYKKEDFEQIAQLSHHIIFNSISNYNLFKNNILETNSIGLRINPQVSTTSCSMYDPCAINSRLGITFENLQQELNHNKDLLKDIDGFHIHTLCEQNSSDLKVVLEVFEDKFSHYFKYLKWINLGGGHLITKDGYDIKLLIAILTKFRQKYPHITIYLEPGEAIGWGSGVLVASVLDIVHNHKNIAILDTSAEAHMPDTLLMPYKADVRDTNEAFNYNYILGGNSCLAGDIMGEYNFNTPLNIGDKIIFEDMIHYTIVKNTTFNGMKLPSLAVCDKNNNIVVHKKFGYNNYKNRN